MTKIFVSLLLFATCVQVAAQTLAVPNDNRSPAGSLRDDRLSLRLTAQPVMWQPEGDAGNMVPAFAFAEQDREATIPGPLIRVPRDTWIDVTIENRIPADRPVGLPPENRRSEGMRTVTGDVLYVHGLGAGTETDDVVEIPFGERRSFSFQARTPGTYTYWGDTTGRTMRTRTGLDAQLSGAIVVDPPGALSGTEERVFVITMTDTFDDGSGVFPENGYFELAINGLSWPYTERLRYRVGDKLHWRWLNPSGFEHPMHLHGFHFETRARGDGSRESVFPEETVQHVVTEFMEPGATFRMDWTPTREGNWLMHCHIRDHIIPDPPRSPEERMHDMHDVRQHALQAMAGLVMGITVADEDTDSDTLEPEHRLKLIAREEPVSETTMRRGYAVANADEKTPSGFSSPGPPVFLTRDEVTRISISNEMREPTTVHWHGLELQSIYDGVAGWSGSRGRVAPLIEPGGTFDVFLEPPRAGTFIYHTHMDETEQLLSGLSGPLIVLEPGQSFDPETDRIFLLADSIDGDYAGVTINGSRRPEPLLLEAGDRYRLRLINISAGSTIDVTLRSGVDVLTWDPLAKDGADLPDTLRTSEPATVRTGTGETYDFVWAPSSPMSATLEVDWIFATFEGHLVLEQPIRVE